MSVNLFNNTSVKGLADVICVSVVLCGGGWGERERGNFLLSLETLDSV